MNNEAAYWIALAHLPRWGHLKMNNLIIKFYHEHKLSIEDFFQLSENEWKIRYGLEFKEVEDLKKAKSELANNAFLAETLNNEGYELIPITSAEYSKTLKEKLKIAHAPALLYVKGNKQILHEKSIAIVGSRNASEKSLEFTDNIANHLLIQKGATAVDFDGNRLTDYKPAIAEATLFFASEPTVNYENIILDFLKTGELTVNDILKKLQLTWSENKLRDYLKSQKGVETIHSKPLRFTIKDSTTKQKSLFD